MKDLKIGTCLALLFGAVLLITVLITLVSVLRLSPLKNSNNEIADGQFQRTQQNAALVEEMATAAASRNAKAQSPVDSVTVFKL